MCIYEQIYLYIFYINIFYQITHETFDLPCYSAHDIANIY